MRPSRPRQPTPRRRALATAITVLLCPAPALALDYVWFGGTGAWDVPGNWSLPGPPGSSDRAVVNAGIVSVNAPELVGQLRLAGGALRGGANLSVLGLVEYTGGQIGGFGGQIVANGGLDIAGTATKTLGAQNGTTSSGIVNNAAATWSGTGAFSNWSTGRFTNGATGSLDIQTDANFGGGTFVNEGMLVKSVGAGGAAGNVFTSTFDNTGSISVLQGRLAVSSAFDNRGVIRTAAATEFHGNNASFVNSGLITGDGTVRTAANGALRNAGVVAPGQSVGTLTVDGDFRMEGAGILQFELTSTESFDQLVVLGDVLLTGTLEILNLGYSPQVGDSFRIITFDTRMTASPFGSLTWAGFAPGVEFTATYNPLDVTLNVTAVPEPESWLIWMLGLAGLGTWLRRRRGGLD